MKFDDNSIGMNWGMPMQVFCITNQLEVMGLGPMNLVSIAGSSIWEYFGENKQVVSINDQITILAL